MSRKSVRITPDLLDSLPPTCRACLFWELDPVRRGRLDEDECGAQKRDWLSEVLREWGSCGQVAMVDDEPPRYPRSAPSGFLPGPEIGRQRARARGGPAVDIAGGALPFN